MSMGKDDFLTPNATVGSMIAKGWYCESCKHQCRDENGFKSHCMSQGHQQQMQLLRNDPGRLLDRLSHGFERQFLQHLKLSHQSTRTAATVVWNEYMANRHHSHLNSTRWVTLTEFVKHLGRTGKCKVDETPKGWFVTFIDRERKTIIPENVTKKRPMAQLVKEEKTLTEQIERATKSARYTREQHPTELKRKDGEKIRFVLNVPEHPRQGESNATKR